MFLKKFLIVTLLFLSIIACKNNNIADDISLRINQPNSVYKQGDTLKFELTNPKNLEFSIHEIRLGPTLLDTQNTTFDLNQIPLGNHRLTVSLKKDETIWEELQNITILANEAPKLYDYEILNVFAHDTNSYTQGLEFVGDTLVEGTGQLGNSKLRKINFKTGEIYAEIALDNQLFGEGITILENKIYQLTWRNGMGMVYDYNTLKQLNTFVYGQSKEGWGLCNNGRKIYKSDGTEKIWILDPKSQKEEGYLSIATDKALFKMANELEYHNGIIYSNVYQREGIMLIDEKSGAIVGVVNMSGLKDKVVKDANWDQGNSVLNGIAYHPTRESFFVTGKNWDKLFEIRIFPRQND